MAKKLDILFSEADSFFADKDSFFDTDINSIIQDIDKIPLKSSIQHVAKDNQVIQKPIQSKLAEFKMDPIESLLAQASTPSCLNEFKYEGDNWTSEIILGSEDNSFSNVDLNLANGSLSIKASNVCETEINGKKSKSVSNVKKVISLPKGTIESSIKADCKGYVLHLSGTIKK